LFDQPSSTRPGRKNGFEELVVGMFTAREPELRWIGLPEGNGKVILDFRGADADFIAEVVLPGVILDP
jgi:hypothetical protein